MLSPHANPPTVALLHCYDLIEDFLDSIGISFETYCTEFMGSWIFGYVDALQRSGIRPILICISQLVDQPTRYQHQPTGAVICLIPAARIYGVYRLAQRQGRKAYGGSEALPFRKVDDSNHLRRNILTFLKDIAKSIGSYISTPLVVMAEELQEENCIAILCQEYEYARFDAMVLLGKWLRIPVFATFQGGDRPGSVLEIPLRHLTLRACAGLIVASQQEQKRLQRQYGLAAEHIAPIFNPVDIQPWQSMDRSVARQKGRSRLNIPAETVVVVWHGRIEIERKGLDVLLAAWTRVWRKYHILVNDFEHHTQHNQSNAQEIHLQLLLIGTGSDAEELAEQLQSISGVIWLNEFVRDRSLLQCYLAAADLYVFPSRQEGFPVAPIEAMACGLPVVAANATGVSDILEAGGVIVPCGDVAALADALLSLLENPPERQRLARLAQHRADSRFSPTQVGQQLYQVLIGSG